MQIPLRLHLHDVFGLLSGLTEVNRGGGGGGDLV